MEYEIFQEILAALTPVFFISPSHHFAIYNVGGNINEYESLALQ